MQLDAFPDSGRVFLDANIFLLHYWDQSPSCSRLFERIELGLIQGVTSTTVLGEVTHRLLIAEAILRPAEFLRRLPS